MNRRKEKRVFPMSEFFVSRSHASKLHELRIARDIGGKKFSPSPCRKWGRGGSKRDFADVENREFMVDGKQTEKKQFTLSEKVIRKLDNECFSYGKIPVLVIEFLRMREGIRRKWAVLPYEDFLRLSKGVRDE